MNKYLVMLSIGPVQTMIAAARRSRDLWSGSWLLSELSKAGAKSLAEQGATLIFPYVDDGTLLNHNSEFSVGNKLQVIITAQSFADVENIVEQTKAAVKARFVEEADLALKQLDNVKSDIRQDIWNEQKNGYLEIQAAWVKIDDSTDNGYENAVRKVASTLAARKATRDFSAAATNPYDSAHMIPKSSLDGAFETVLNKTQHNLKPQTRVKLSLLGSEQLDCLGVVKRLGFAGKAEQFTPFTRIAAHAWIEETLCKQSNFNQIKAIYDALFELGVATRVRGNKDSQTGKSIYHNFAYDAQLLYPYRLDAAIAEWRHVDDAIGDQLKLIGDQLKLLDDAIGDQLKLIGDQLKLLKKELMPIWKEHGEPYSYAAMLLADGDRMGELLDQAKSLDEHQQVTKALSEFAESVADTMRQYNGHCIYAGGDDVLGFVPLDQAYDCSKKLSVIFEGKLDKVSNDLGVTITPTLSVGLAVCHIMTPMSVIRDLAQQSEKTAKGDHITEVTNRRNALSLLLSVRSGTDINIRYQWSDEKSLNTFKQWISLYVEKSIPSRVAYDIRNIHIRTNGISKGNTEEAEKLHADIRAAELKRMLIQARSAKGDAIDSKTVEALMQRGAKIGLDKLADELIVARWFAAKTQQELGRE